MIRQGHSNGVDLDERKKKILAAVVEEYIRNATPVGSKTVVKRGVRTSPATVRSQMVELEAEGLLEQPHTSAGRMPTDAGFRYYVDHLMNRYFIDPGDRAEIESVYNVEDMTGDRLTAETARVLSALSRYVGIVMFVPAERAPLSGIYLFESAGRIRVVLEFLGGGHEERIIENKNRLEQTALQRLSNVLNRFARGRTLVGLRRELIRQREEAKQEADHILFRAVELSESLVAAERPEVIVKGQANLFDLPEFSDIDKVRQVVRTFEEKSILVDILEQASFSSGIRVTIGRENKIRDLQDFSVLTSTYGRGDSTAGALGVIGPVRMEYARLVPLVGYTSELISECMRRYG